MTSDMSSSHFKPSLYVDWLAAVVDVDLLFIWLFIWHRANGPGTLELGDLGVVTAEYVLEDVMVVFAETWRRGAMFHGRFLEPIGQTLVQMPAGFGVNERDRERPRVQVVAGKRVIGFVDATCRNTRVLKPPRGNMF